GVEGDRAEVAETLDAEAADRVPDGRNRVTVQGPAADADPGRPAAAAVVAPGLDHGAVLAVARAEEGELVLLDLHPSAECALVHDDRVAAVSGVHCILDRVTVEHLDGRRGSGDRGCRDEHGCDNGKRQRSTYDSHASPPSVVQSRGSISARTS